ncbi:MULTISPECIES: N-acetylmuramoyl-L-alanine amidase [unclassified Synechococcus]|uniref:N-acetylmuramoyl-L-alanine amidase n=1 Tax=unclassified Synechococcus TaxID=2626047 RepID=UPI0021A2E644|nr:MULTISPECIES: peptidoglycan recognition family protein [unclassified Synechococcus]MCT0214444.1 peptidoglycan recognition protein family protein [Synechococcus sp. CS-1326]MCT0233253.1 peptidoglycan recognition protein family protein [Synechococcus sp. CS-1327]
MLNLLRQVRRRLQPRSLQRTGSVALGLAALVGIGGLGWVARDVTAGQGSTGRPSLLQLLDQVSPATPPAAEPPRQASPSPPVRAAWISPLRRQCTVTDTQLSQSLQRQLAGLSGSMRRLRIDPTNYGERFRGDAFGNPLDPTPRIVVLHETVYGMESAVQTFLTPHPRDQDQVSYHMLIGLDGEVVEALDPSRRAFGAGNSAFNGQWVVTNPKVGGSVNNFALHVSLETPIDGEDNDSGHSGYTRAQYDALAVVLADWMRRFKIPPTSITTHRQVDIGGERSDPRSFDWQALQLRLAALGLLC